MPGRGCCEYAHLTLHHEGGRWPAWFNEGTAVFYETLRGTKEGIEAGAPDPGRLAILRKGAWAPISYLISIDSAAKLPSLDATQRFYAQSWVYVHMLHLAPAYRDHFPEFRTLAAEGASLEDLVRRLYSKSLIQFDDDARAWARQLRFPTEHLQAPPEAAASVETGVIEQLDVEITRGIAAGYGSSKPSDGGAYPRLARIVGNRCDRQPALGDLAFAERRFSEASKHYQEALRCGVNSNALLQGLESALSYRSDVPEAELESLAALNRRSVETPPDPLRRLPLRSMNRVEGEIIRIDCMGEGARLWLRSGSETKKLLITDPTRVFSGPDGGPQFEFKCGTQKRGAVVGYVGQNDPATDTVGRVLYVEIR